MRNNAGKVPEQGDKCRSSRDKVTGWSGRYINFLSGFMAANRRATMAAAIRAWKAVKRMNSPEDYRAFARPRD